MLIAAGIIVGVIVMVWVACIVGQFLALSSDADGSEMQREREGWDDFND